MKAASLLKVSQPAMKIVKTSINPNIMDLKKRRKKKENKKSCLFDVKTSERTSTSTYKRKARNKRIG